MSLNTSLLPTLFGIINVCRGQRIRLLIALNALLLSALPANAATITAASTSYADVQTAYNLTSIGDTLQIPAGSSIWGNTLTIRRGIFIQGAGTNSTILTSSLGIVDGNPVPFMEINLDLDRPVRVKDIKFVDASGTDCGGVNVAVGNVHETQVRITGCVFENVGFAVRVRCAWGVMDNCDFINCGLPFRVRGYFNTAELNGYPPPPYAWNSASYFVVENCRFRYDAWTRDSYVCDTETPSNYMVRYCHTVANRAAAVSVDAFDMHGEFNDSIVRELGPQIYANTWVVTGNTTVNPMKWADIRGGANTLVYSNVVTGIAGKNQFRDNLFHLPLMTNTYVWANFGNGGSTPMVNAQFDGVQVNVNYFTNPPSNFSQLPYPHPLVQSQDSGGGGSVGPFSLATPANGATVTLTPLLQWTASTNTAGYLVRVFFGANVIYQTAVSAASEAHGIPVGVLTNSSTYTWNITSTNVAGTRLSSNGPFSMTTVPPPPPDPFNLISPPNGALNATLTPQLQWQPSARATSFIVKIGTNAGFSGTLAYNANVGNVTSFTPPNGTLANSVTYWWNAAATNAGGGTLSANGPFSFRTQDAPPPPPPNPPGGFQLLGPGDAATGLSTSPTLSWASSTDAAGYLVQVSTDVGFGSFVLQAAAAANSFTVPAGTLSAATLYYWRASATNVTASTTASNAPRSFNTAPGDFALLSPADGATGTSRTPVLVCSASQSAVGYTVEIALDAAFASIVNSAILGPTTTNYTVPAGILSFSTNYFWRFKANANNALVAATNAPFDLTVQNAPIPAAFDLYSPADAATGVSLSPTLSWTVSSGADNYVIEVATDTTFTAILHTGLVTGTTNHVVPGGILGFSTTYAWRARANNAFGDRFASNGPRTFTTASAPPPPPAGPGAFTLISPDAVTLTDLNPTFIWNTSSDATEYYVRIVDPAAVQTNPPVVLVFAPATNLVYNGTNLLGYGTAYEWFVIASNSVTSLQGANAPRTFTTPAAPAPPLPAAFTQTTPAANATSVSVSPVFVWAASSGAERYRFEIATDTTFSGQSPVHSATVDAPPSGSVSYALPTALLNYNQPYWWRVTANNSVGDTQASNQPLKFTTGTQPVPGVEKASLRRALLAGKVQVQ